MSSPIRGGPPAQKVLGPLMVLALAAVIYSLPGFGGAINRDDAIYFYGGQRFADGVPPYFGVFDIKGPLSQMLPAVGVFAAKLLGTDDLLTTRLFFFLLSCLTVSSVYLLARQIFGSARAGLFAALTFLGFGHFTWRAGSGPEIKSALVLFETLCLLFAGQRRWAWAGVAGAMAALIWQPAGIFLLAVLLTALLQARGERGPAFLRVAGGIAVPLGVIFAYFAARGGMGEFIDATVFFGFRYLERGYPSPLTPFANMVWEGAKDFRSALAPIAIGFGMMGVLSVVRVIEFRSGARQPGRDPLVPLLLSFPMTVAWSLVDFGGGTDFYWFLPYLAVGFGRVLDLAVTAVDTTREAMTARVLTAGITAALVLLAGLTALSVRESGLTEQRAFAASIERRFSKEVRFLTIGVPEILVLLHRVNPTRHILLHYGFDRRVDATTPGGLEGWIAGLEAYRPDVVLFPLTNDQATEPLMAWLASHYREERGPTWRIFVRRR